MYRPKRRFKPPIKNNGVKQKEYNFKINQEDLTTLIYLLELSQNEILRMFKKLSESDFDLKEMYWYYRQKNNKFRKMLKEIRGF